MKEIIVNTPTEENVSFIEGSPYCHIFVYSQKGNYLYKGTYTEVKKELTILSENTEFFCNIVFFHKGKSRNRWTTSSEYNKKTLFRFLKKGDCFIPYANLIITSAKLKYSCKYYAEYFAKKHIFHNKTTNKLVEFRRLPKKWVPELNALFM